MIEIEAVVHCRQRCGMTVDDPGEDVCQISERIDVVQLAGSISEATVAQCSAPPSEPANSAFFRLSAIGRMERSRSQGSIAWVSGRLLCRGCSALLGTPTPDVLLDGI
jgi:hypothetical protein